MVAARNVPIFLGLATRAGTGASSPTESSGSDLQDYPREGGQMLLFGQKRISLILSFQLCAILLKRNRIEIHIEVESRIQSC